MTALLVLDTKTDRRLGAAWDAITADEKACAFERRGHRVAIVPVSVSGRAFNATRRHRAERQRKAQAPRPPAGYRIRERLPIAASTARRPWTDWCGEWSQIKAAGDWTEWGDGHATAPTVVALEARGKLLVAEWHGRGRRRRNLFLAVD